MRWIARFLETLFSVSFLAILFTSLLIGANLFITRSFATTVTAHGITQTDDIARAPAIPEEPLFCKNLIDLTCADESYSSRKRSILEYSGRCLKDEMPKMNQDFVGYIHSLEKKLLGDQKQFKSFFNQIKSNLLTALQRETALPPKKRKEYARRLKSLQWLSSQDHIRLGGAEEFKKTCGEWGMEENASYTIFADGTQHVVVCPGRLIAAIKKESACSSPELDYSSMIYTLSHEMGHSIGGNFFSFDTKKNKWITKEDKSYAKFQTCMKEKFSQFQQKDFGEASADYWASKSMAVYLEKNQEPHRNQIFKNTMAGLCGTSKTSRHLPGNVRIQDVIGGQNELRSALGCQSSRLERTCQI